MTARVWLLCGILFRRAQPMVSPSRKCALGGIKLCNSCEPASSLPTSQKPFLWPVLTETQPAGSFPGIRQQRTLVNSQPHLNCLEVWWDPVQSEAFFAPACFVPRNVVWQSNTPGYFLLFQSHLIPSSHQFLPLHFSFSYFPHGTVPGRQHLTFMSCSSSLHCSTEEMRGLLGTGGKVTAANGESHRYWWILCQPTAPKEKAFSELLLLSSGPAPPWVSWCRSAFMQVTQKLRRVFTQHKDGLHQRW